MNEKQLLKHRKSFRAMIGFAELSPGVYLYTKEDILSDQKSWEEGGKGSAVDLTKADFWMTTDNGVGPLPFDSITDALESLDED